VRKVEGQKKVEGHKRIKKYYYDAGGEMIQNKICSAIYTPWEINIRLS
jgi:hypothetical protein